MPDPLPLAQTAAPPAQRPLEAPGAPTATPAPTAELPVGVLTQVPRTQAELRALTAQREELSNQLTSAAGRREELVKDLEGATGTSRAGIEARIQLLDQRILQIEGDIASTGRILSQARGSILTPSPFPQRGNNMENVLVPIVGMLSVFVFFPLVFVFARNMWRRGSAQKVESTLERDNADRLSRLEGAIDSIAIEMERVSEGQRFVTKLLAESHQREPARIERP